MPVSADTLRLHLNYAAWASQRLLDAAAALPPDDLTRDFKTADGTIAGTLAHIFGADRLWLDRIHGVSRSVLIAPEDRDFPTLEKAWPALHQRWSGWAASIT